MGIYTLFVLSISDKLGGKELYRSEQPEGVDYGSFDPYQLTIVEGSVQWDALGWPRSSILSITRSEDSSYGHFIEIDFPGANKDGFEAEWHEAGLAIRFPSGHNLEIPKASFMGGR